ncbi:rhodanese-like domain-containing protein [Rummeliibacillus sp. JY-2-4R]
MPIVKTKKAMNQLMDGQILEVQATDKGSIADLHAWSETVGHQYIGVIEEDGVILHYIRKCSDEAVVEQSYEPTIKLSEIEERANNGGLILDVREEAEYAFGHIDGAKSIPMGELDERLEELNKNQEIYVICRSGKRSDLAAQKLTKAGYTKVFNVLPGMTDWQGKTTKLI